MGGGSSCNGREDWVTVDSRHCRTCRYWVTSRSDVSRIRRHAKLRAMFDVLRFICQNCFRAQDRVGGNKRYQVRLRQFSTGAEF